MTDDQIADLKQFIAKVVSNEVSSAVDNLGKRIDKVESRLDGVESRLDGVESRLDTIEEDVHDIKVMQNEILNVVGHDIEEVKDVQQNHEVRITNLEAKAA